MISGTQYQALQIWQKQRNEVLERDKTILERDKTILELKKTISKQELEIVRLQGELARQKPSPQRTRAPRKRKVEETDVGRPCCKEKRIKIFNKKIPFGRNMPIAKRIAVKESSPV